jgi:hypothetical protein
MSGFLGFLHKRITQPADGSVAAYQAVTAAADVFRYSPNAPAQVVRWGFIATTTVNDGSNALKLTCDFRPTAGSNVSRTTGATTTIQTTTTGYNAAGQPALFSDAAGGSLTLVASTTQVVAGQGVYHTVNPQTGSGSPALYPQPDTVSGGGVNTQFTVYPGQEVLIAIQATAPGAGAGIFFMELREQPFQGDTQLPAALALTPSNSISNMVRKFL